jgi:MFS transporter, PAT family, beta-lactamase induction signal transducer AmpG
VTDATKRADKRADKRDWAATLATYSHPRVLQFLFLGFSAGLPFLLVFSTLSAWLREFGISRTAIGFISWIGITYSFKFVWSPVVDRVPLPLLTRWLGRRRAWMLLAQTGIAGGLLAMSFCDPRADLWHLVMFALIVAFS